jgi:hypothetical protein
MPSSGALAGDILDSGNVLPDLRVAVVEIIA